MQRSKWTTLSLATLLAGSIAGKAFGADAVNAVTQTQNGPTGATQYAAPSASDSAQDPVKTCQAYLSTLPVPEKKTGFHPVRLVAKAMVSELGTDASGMLKDSMFVFSAKDFDPYDKKAPKNKPYTLLEIQMIDGSQASVVKYPDNSGKVVGGFADGTIIAPSGPNSYIVAYPNGARGKLVKINGIEYDVYRPDNTVTRIKKTASGDYDMTNNKLGYLGTARTDTLGMQFEMNSSDF
ncbi:MAG: hypothetical protein U0103_09060 [Candidatus Obscuribacterales bacterium]|nr:hypothetical protein [Cyanobacteria bacterium SZAS LIN-5]RTL45339.1 MAG: hypothetical protein EKK48_02570 [Candidatus Melainabacteria bacterium]